MTSKNHPPLATAGWLWMGIVFITFFVFALRSQLPNGPATVCACNPSVEIIAAKAVSSVSSIWRPSCRMLFFRNDVQSTKSYLSMTCRTHFFCRVFWYGLRSSQFDKSLSETHFSLTADGIASFRVGTNKNSSTHEMRRWRRLTNTSIRRRSSRELMWISLSHLKRFTWTSNLRSVGPFLYSLTV